MAKPSPNMRTGALLALFPLGVPLLGVLLLSGCGDKQKNEAKHPEVKVDNEDEFDDGMEMMQEFGGMNEEKVTKTFTRLAPDLSNCLTTQGASEEYLAGDVAFLVKVDRSGKAVAALAEKSNLGSFQAERCMLKILKAATWPKPVGGYIGLARWSIGFDAPGDIRPPVEWTSSEIEETLGEDENAQSLAACGGSGPFEITAYVSRSGKVLSAGVAHSDDNGEDAAQCIVSTLKEMTFPSPGSWQAKVTFTR